MVSDSSVCEVSNSPPFVRLQPPRSRSSIRMWLLLLLRLLRGSGVGGWGWGVVIAFNGVLT